MACLCVPPACILSVLSVSPRVLLPRFYSAFLWHGLNIPKLCLVYVYIIRGYTLLLTYRIRR